MNVKAGHTRVGTTHFSNAIPSSVSVSFLPCSAETRGASLIKVLGPLDRCAQARWTGAHKGCGDGENDVSEPVGII
jgi:hypothetical protein